MKTPQVAITQTSNDPITFRINGWEEFDQWARLNHGRWAAVSKGSSYHGLTNDERIKLLAYNLLLDNQRQNEEMVSLKMQAQAIFKIE
jgi:hypothetical protein